MKLKYLNIQNTYTITGILNAAIYDSRIFCGFIFSDASIATMLFPLRFYTLREFDFD